METSYYTGVKSAIENFKLKERSNGGTEWAKWAAREFQRESWALKTNGRIAFLVARSAYAKARRLEVLHPRFLLLAQALPMRPSILCFSLDIASLKRSKVFISGVFSRFDERLPVFSFSSVSNSCFFIGSLTEVLNASLTLDSFFL